MKQSILSCIFIITVSISALWSQTQTGTLSGKVTAAGSAVPDAAVTITNSSTGDSKKVLTDSSGLFTIIDLPPGSYQVTVETAGFKRASQQNVQLSTSAPVTIEVTLEPGNAVGSAEVIGMTPMVQSEDSQVAESFTTRLVRELPIIDRNFQVLTGLMTGITSPFPLYAPVLDPQQNRFWNTNGQSMFANNHRLDDAENNEPYLGLASHIPTAESIRQMNVATSNYDASVGRVGGAWVNVLTQSGTNRLHGSLFEFHSNNGLNARSVFNNSPNPQPHSVLNQFGGTVGGPIVPDHTFFFGSYEGLYRRQSVTEIATVPTPEFRAGNFSDVSGLTLFNPNTGNMAGVRRAQFVNNQIPGSQINTAARNILPFIPLPNRTGLENNFVTNVPFRQDGQPRLDGRIDHRFNDRTSIYLKYGYSRFYVAQGAPLGSLIGEVDESFLRNHNAVIGLTHGFSPSLFTDLRLNYNRYSDQRRGNNLLAARGSDLGFSDLNTAGAAGLPSIQIAGMGFFGTPSGLPSRGIDNTYNLRNTWSKQAGRNDFKWGFDLWGIQADGFQNLAFQPQGGFIFSPGATSSPAAGGIGPNGTFANSFAAFLLGAPSVSGRSNLLVEPGYRQGLTSLFAGDKVHLTSRVTLDLGIRYELFSPISARRTGGAGIYDPTTNSVRLAGAGSLDKTGNADWDLDNIAPRIGFAIRATDRTAVRGGWGMSYFPGTLAFTGGFLNPVTSAIQQGFLGGFGVAGNFGPLPGIPVGSSAQNGVINSPTNQSFIVSPTHVDTPYVQSFSFMVQQDLGSSTLIDVAYVGTLGRHLPFSQELNAAQPGTGITGLPLFLPFGRTASTILRTTGLTNNYNSLQVNLSKRMSHGLSFSGAYTFSKALDFGSNEFQPINMFSFRSNYGPADFDRKHLLTISHLWQLPIGTGTNRLNHGVIGNIFGNWQLNGVFRWASGAPINITADPTACQCPGNVVFANVTGPVGNAPGGQFFNTSAFAAPGADQFGNLGRNSVRGAGFRNYDMSLFKTFAIMEQARLELRGEVYNLTNSPHFANPSGNVNSGSFGQFNSTLFGLGPREIHLALRVLF